MKRALVWVLLMSALSAIAAPGSYTGSVDNDYGGGSGGNLLNWYLLASFSVPFWLKILGPWREVPWGLIVMAGFGSIVFGLVAVQYFMLALIAVPIYVVYVILKAIFGWK